MKIKAIVVKQPFASLIAQGYKTIETRTWPTKHRGPLLIVAGKRPVAADRAAVLAEPHKYPLGVALAVVQVAGCRRHTPADSERSLVPHHDKLYAWELGSVALIEPIPIKGAQRIFTVNVPYLDRIFGHIAAEEIKAAAVLGLTPLEYLQGLAAATRDEQDRICLGLASGHLGKINHAKSLYYRIKPLSEKLLKKAKGTPALKKLE